MPATTEVRQRIVYAPEPAVTGSSPNTAKVMKGKRTQVVTSKGKTRRVAVARIISTPTHITVEPLRSAGNSEVRSVTVDVNSGIQTTMMRNGSLRQQAVNRSLYEEDPGLSSFVDQIRGRSDPIQSQNPVVTGEGLALLPHQTYVGAIQRAWSRAPPSRSRGTVERHLLSWHFPSARSLWLFASLGASALMSANAQAVEDSRTLTFFHTHTEESTTVTFRRGNSYVSDGLKQLNHFLRDWRAEQSTSMDPRLFDIIWEVHRAVGSRSPVHIISAYRSPQTNQALRSRSRAVSEHSQHMLGKAMDIRFPDVDPGRIREAAMRVQQGGVGFYPGANFVHVDVGSVRAWPRMSREQLAQLFPDGKTVQLPPDGKPLAGYEQARAEILSRGSTGSSEPGVERRSLWASLFGRRNDRLTPVPATARQVGSLRKHWPMFPCRRDGRPSTLKRPPPIPLAPSRRPT